MAALGNDRLLYLHIPKTGGHWVEAALAAAGVQVEREGHERHVSRDGLDTAGRFAFAFVREPLSWYASWWRHCRVIDPTWRTRGLAYPNSPHLYFVNLPLEQYIEAVVSNAPGFLSRYYCSFTGPPDDPIAFVGRYENLVEDMVHALRGTGVSFNEAALRGVGPLNRSGSSPALPARLENRTREAELETYERYYSMNGSTKPASGRQNGADAGRASEPGQV